MRLLWIVLCALFLLLCVGCLKKGRERYEQNFFAQQKLQSTVTPDAAHRFAKICRSEDEEVMRQYLQTLVDQYKRGSAEQFGFICTVRWEREDVGNPLVDAVEVRVFVKQHIGPLQQQASVSKE